VSSTSEIAEFLNGLPRRIIPLLPSDTPLPKLKASGQLGNYNGFTGGERLRTFEIAKWLIKSGSLTHSGRCDICGGPADQQHAEDYFDLATWMDVCRGCHTSLHGRLRTPVAWARRLESFSLAAAHWARELPPTELDVAGLHRSKQRGEPTAADFIAPQNG
jgi:hypothetical protein